MADQRRELCQKLLKTDHSLTRGLTQDSFMTPDEQQNSDLSLRIAMEKDPDTMMQLVHELEELTTSQGDATKTVPLRP
jgi:hypothetical protein